MRNHSFRAEFVYTRMLVSLPGPQDGGGKLRLIRRIRKVLSFQTERVTMLVHLAALAHIAAVQEITRIVQSVKPQHNIAKPTISIGHQKPDHNPAVVGNIRPR